MKSRLIAASAAIGFALVVTSGVAPEATATVYTSPYNSYCTFDYSSGGAYNGSMLEQYAKAKLLTGCQRIQAEISYKGSGASILYGSGATITSINGTSTAWAGVSAAMVTGHTIWYMTGSVYSKSW